MQRKELNTIDDHGTTALGCLLNEKGVEKVMSMLYDLLSPTRDYPILHHIFINAPQHKDVFMKEFPWAYHLKDHNGRTLHQAVLAAGPNVMNKNDMILASLTDNQIQTKDPTTLYLSIRSDGGRRARRFGEDLLSTPSAAISHGETFEVLDWK